MTEPERHPADIALLGCAMLAVTLVLAFAFLGVPRETGYGGHDSSFSIRALYFLGTGGFWRAMTTGWLPQMQLGFGAPVFQFYPPLAFALGLGVQRALATDAVTALAITVALARLGGGLACFLWLRHPAGSRGALLGASAYVLLPFTGLFDPVIRFAYAEAIATALLPLLPWALDAGRVAAGQRVAALGAVMAALILTNMPVAVAAVLCCGVYAAVIGWRRVVEAVAGGALALGLTAWHLLPAGTGLNAISAHLMMDEGHHWSGTMLFWGSMALHQVDLIWDLLYLMFLLFAGVAILGVLRGESQSQAIPARASLAGLVAALALCTPLTLPLWRWGQVLDFVQFPWRFLLLASLFGSGVIALVRAERVRFGLALLVFALGLVAPAGVLTIDMLKRERGVVFEPAATRLAEAVGAPHADAPEYLPTVARREGWPQRLSTLAAAQDLPKVDAGTASIEAFGWVKGKMKLAGRASAGAAILLPQFAYPGWQLTGSAGTRMEPDSETGLLRLMLPEGPFAVTLSRAPLPLARQGLLISACAVLAALVLFLARRPRGMTAVGAKCSFPLSSGYRR